MDQRAEYFLQVLEKIGSPLMEAIIERPHAEASTADEAQAIAALLSRTVQASIDIGKTMNFAALGEQGDALRLALAGLASNLISVHYKTNGKMPAEADIKRLTTALQAVLAFSENFSGDQSGAEALKTLQANGSPASPMQMTVQFIQAFVPVVNAVGSFSFGQPEQTMIMDVAQRLLGSATDLAASIPGARSEADKRAAELAVLQALAQLYATSHRMEIARLMGLSDEQRQNQGANSGSIERIWQGFEARLGMLAHLTGSIMGTSSGTKTAVSGGTKAPAAASPAPAVAAPLPQAAPASKPAVFSAPPASSSPVPPPAAPPAAGGVNPLSMFAKKPEEGTAAAAVTPPPQQAASGPGNQPPEPPSGQSSPMAFFKGPVRKTDES